MKKYVINIFSSTIAAISGIILIVVFTSIFALMYSGRNQFLNPLIFFSLIVIVYLIVRFISKGKIEIELTEKGFKHTWIKKFLFSKEIDIKLDWQDIINYGGGGYRLHETYQLILTNNRKYRIYRWANFPPKDDYVKFEKDFPRYLKMMNKLKNKVNKLQ